MSKFKELVGKTAGIQPRSNDKPNERPAKTAPVMLYDTTARMHAAEQRAEEPEALLTNVEKQGGAKDIALTELHEVAGRKRSLTTEQFDELRENLRRNELVTPITVRPRSEGGYEIVSGHNRFRAYQELGRKTIAAVVYDTDAARADINAFYANLLQPALPDFEKYLGFRLIRSRHPEMSQDQIGEMAGVSQSLLSRLLSFEDLPQEALSLLAQHPNCIGAAAASNFAALVKQGRAEQVIGALRRIVEEGLDQASAVRLASKANDSQTKTAEVITYRVGKAALCNYRRLGTTLRIDFKHPEHAEAVHKEIEKVLERYAADLKTAKE